MIGKDEHSNIKSDPAEDTTPDLGVGLALGKEGGVDGGGGEGYDIVSLNLV